MRWPWISRSSHEETTGLLINQLAELKAERTILLDRLAQIGLGGPMFNLPTDSSTDEPEEELVDPQAEIDRIMAMSKRPSLMAREIKKRALEEMNRRGPDVKWIPQAESVMKKLDAAEAAGRKQA